MQVWSLVTRKSSLSPIAWAGLYYVESIHADGYIAGKCVCLYSDEDANVLYPLYELYNVGKGTGRYIEYWHITKNGTLVSDDGQELETLA